VVLRSRDHALSIMTGNVLESRTPIQLTSIRGRASAVADLLVE
jgi:hypothetical protein